MKQRSQNTLKIALVCDDSLDRPDGVQQFVTMLGEWLRAEGHNVHYITSSSERTDLPNLHVVAKNLEVKFNGNRLRPPLPAQPHAVRELLRREAFDIIHVQMPYSPLLAGQVVAFAPETSTLVGTFHILPESRLVATSANVLGLLSKPQLKKFSAFTSTSEPTRTFMNQTYRVNSKVIPNMTDVSRFSVHPPKREQHVRITFLGRLVERKGARYLLQAVNELEKLGIPQTKYHVHIGGKGPLLQVLQEYVNTQNLTELVTFDGFVPEENKAAYLAAADVAVFPSTGGESFGISIIEAMAATPGIVLAGNNPGYASVLAERPKQLIDPKDTELFAYTLARCIDNSTERAVARAWQRDMVKQYDIAVVGKKFETLYYDTLRRDEE